MGTNTRPAREGLCAEVHILVHNRMLFCDREAQHDGQHFDRTEWVWWYPGAPHLETVKCGKVNPRKGWVCGLPFGHTGEYDSAAGRHLTIIEGERFDWKEG